MPAKKVAPKTETPVAPAVEAAPVAQKAGAAKKTAAPVAQKVETAPAAPVTQKGGKKAPASKAETPAPVEAAPVAQKGGKKAAAPKTEKAAAPKAEKAAPAPKAKAVAQKAGAAKGEKKAASALKGGKKAAAPKKVETESKEDGEESGDRHIRSFKVRLPGKEEFEGRFTGLTPYQAANKALSKYFRETEKPKAEITFSICESTRKSMKRVYTYVGRRQKLDTPVSYKIQDGREIVKNFKNSLKKVKKADAPTESA